MSARGFSRERVQAALLLLVVFAAGALSATAVLRVVNADPPPRVTSALDDAPMLRPAPTGRGGRGARLAPDLVQQLGLTDAQRAAVDTILRTHADRSRAILEGVEPELQAQLDSARGAIRAVLDENQRETFDGYIDRHRGFMEHRFGRRGDGPPRGDGEHRFGGRRDGG